MADVNAGPVQTLDDGGFIVVWQNVGGVFGWYNIPVGDVGDVKATAESALQPDQVTLIVNEDPEAYVRVTDQQVVIDDLNRRIALQDTAIANLQAQIGAGLIHVLADGIVVPGVVV